MTQHHKFTYFQALLLQSFAIRNISSFAFPAATTTITTTLLQPSPISLLFRGDKDSAAQQRSLSSAFRRFSIDSSSCASQKPGQCLFASSSSSSSSTTPTMTNIVNDYKWFPTTHLLDIDTKTLSTIPSERKDDTKQTLKDGLLPRLGKDEAYVNAVQTAWRTEVKKRSTASSDDENIKFSVGSKVKYECKDNDDTIIFHGYVVRPSTDNKIPTDNDDNNNLPGIIFFHTGAGPQDLFLRWKADSLVCDNDIFHSTKGCIVFIADITSDERGWGWDNDKTHYGNVREGFLTYNEDKVRSHLRTRIMAAIAALERMPGVDTNNMAAMGWCLGGQVMAELGRMKYPGIRALASFHGVFDGVADGNDGADDDESPQGQAPAPPTPQKAKTTNDNNNNNLTKKKKTEAIICHGLSDPYIPRSDLQRVQSILTKKDVEYTMHEFEKVRHGFTNPAQEFNPNDKFHYDEEAANVSWEACRSLLKRCLVSNGE